MSGAHDLAERGPDLVGVHIARDRAVPHRRGDVRVSREALHDGNGYALLDEPRDATVPQHMRGQSGDTGTACESSDDIGARVWGDGLTRRLDHEARRAWPLLQLTEDRESTE